MKRIMQFIIGAVLILFSSCKDLPLASFCFLNNTAEVGDTIYFQGSSRNAITFNWDFGDGSSSTEENPWHIYSAEGIYNVILAVSNLDGSDEASGKIWINQATGDVIETVIHSPGLEGNLLGDTPDKAVSVYLPPGYKHSLDKYYPVIYLLHGYNGTNRTWFGSTYMFFSVKPILDELIAEKRIEPMIAVAPNSKNKYGGSWYTNSSVSGNWEDFIVHDVVNYMDENYRTLPKASSRGIAGHSMGGYGTITLAMKHPDVFGATYSLGGARLVFSEELSGTTQESIDQYYSGPISEIHSIMSTVVAWLPNPSIPDYLGEIPFTEDGKIKDSVLKVMMGHDPYSMIVGYKSNLKELSLVQLDCGKSDRLLIQNRIFSQELSANGIDHVYLEYDGDHNNRTADRLKEYVFPAFSQHLDHE